MRPQIHSPKSPAPDGVPGVYADLAALVALRHKARGFNFLPRQPVHSVLTGRYASRLRGRGLNFEELRQYRPGDDIRAMDWKATARTRKPQLRVYTEERDRPVLLIVDQRLGMFFGSKRAMKSVTAAETAALAAWRVLAVGDRVGGIVFGDEAMEEIRPHRSEARVMQILKTVVDFNRRLAVGREAPGSAAMLGRVLERTARLAAHDALIAIISDFRGFDATCHRHVTRMAAHNDVIAITVVDPMGEALPDAGRVVVSDGEKQLEVDTSDPAIRAKFAKEFKEDTDEAIARLAALAVPTLMVRTDAGVAEQVRAALGHARDPESLAVFEDEVRTGELVGLREIRLPEPVSLAPDTTAWWVLLAILAALLLALIYVLVRRWRRNAYRRAALAELALLRADAARGDAAVALAPLPALVKRSALDAWPRAEVAALSGPAWLAFLDGSYGGSGFREGAGRHLSELAYASPTLEASQADGLLDVVETWLRRHRV